ncbi:GNAT family N-acetyltransferase [Emticicia oligotrophica]|uniref:GNAT family N-acetyltransferase n=1 Tax=Emticicia oligotrophica TaxID=312279 RepID=UPI00273BC3AF|nr:GNAT family N-acetyltransferase [Emticicia oligotrophica]
MRKIEIEKISSEQDLEDVKQLFREYVEFLQVNLDFQDFENELAKLPAKYAEPEGSIFLAKVNGQPAGCIALWKLEDGVCEMKRLFVKTEFQGLGLGKMLANRLMEEAKAKGYSIMKLDTLRRLESANYLYASLGFGETQPYNFNPEPDIVYFEKTLV